MNHVLPCYPSVHTHRTAPISPASARRKLDRYLKASETHAHHHPDAVLTPGGVTFSAASGPRGNLTMSNLRRIVQGLNGEDLAPTDEELAQLEFRGAPKGERVWEGRGLEGIGNSKDRGLARRSALKKSGEADEAEERRRRDELNAGDETEGWMDMEEFERTRDMREGEVDEMAGATVLAQGGDVAPPEIATTADAGEDGSAGVKRKLTETEKEQRKAEKKMRNKAAQKEKEKRRSGR
ncbi:hypothetical protein ANO11243_014370 [Dothideomycetidae sp. 11243]|nr:hypothetical protein ANO11243_014370 [fungal sp. No.11243]